MANSFISVQEIARQTLPRLIDNLVFPNLVHKDYSDDYVSGKGKTIKVKKPVKLTASDFDASVGTSSQDIKEEAVDVTLDKLATVDVDIASVEMATNVDDLVRLVLEPAAVALAEKINADGLALYKDIPYISGTAGTTPSTMADIANARKVLNINKVPTSDRFAVWDASADAEFTKLANLFKVNESGDYKALREGEIGRLLGFDNYMSQAVKSHTVGTAISGGKTATLAAAATKGADSISVDLAASTGTFAKGDLITIADKLYVVTADASLSTTAATVKIYPALAADAADNTAITFTGSATVTTYANNLAFHKNAFAFVTRPLLPPKGVESYATSFNGITLRVVRGYDMTYKKEKMSIDILYGYKTMYPELATRVLG